MKIKKICLVVLAGLITACAVTVEDPEEKKAAYVQPEKVALERSAEDRAQTLTDLGLAYYKLGKYTFALEYLDRSLKIDDKNAVTYQVIASINERSNKLEQAQLYYDKALKLAPDNFDIVTSYAVFLFHQDRNDEALREFNRVADAPFYKKKWVAYTYLGYYDLKNKQTRQAEKRFYYALKANEYYAPALLEMARIRFDKGEMMSARAYIERYFGQAGKTQEGLQLAIKIENALQSYDMVEQYQLELKREFPFAD